MTASLPSRDQAELVPPGAPACCPACGATAGVERIYGLDAIPAQSMVPLASAAAARDFPVGVLELVWCAGCGLAFNARFNATLAEAVQGREDSQGSSPTFRRFATDLARGWIDRYGLAGRHLLEIGCGQGDFLRLMCAEGGCTGTGFDPAFGASGTTPPGLTFRAERFAGAHVPVAADFIVCRHTLEHIADVSGFLALMRAACGTRGDIRLGFELPEFSRILNELAFWDIYHEHCVYFTSGALARAFLRAGFDVLDIRLAYADQYLILEAAPAIDPAGPVLRAPQGHASTDDLAETARAVARFRREVPARIAAWQRQFAAWAQAGQRVALWGSGSKAVGFLTTIGNMAPVACVVDINPARQGIYMPGCPMPVVAPADLAAHRPDVVLVMNPIYLEEIRATLAGHGLAPALRAINTPPTWEGWPA